MTLQKVLASVPYQNPPVSAEPWLEVQSSTLFYQWVSEGSKTGINAREGAAHCCLAEQTSNSATFKMRVRASEHETPPLLWNRLPVLRGQTG